MSRLLAHHAALIAESGISAEVAEARGYFSAGTKVELARLGFSSIQCSVPALVVPIWNVHGEIGAYLARPDRPRVKDGRTLKYEAPQGSTMVLDVPRTIRQKLGDPSVPLLITEGARKADAAVSAGLCCVSLIGTWAWRGTNELGGKALLPDFESIAMNGRDIFVVFDSDVMTKESVHAALARFVPVLKQRDASVQVVYLPPGPDGAKVGLDDFLAAGNTVADLLALARLELQALPVPVDSPPYSAGPGGLVWERNHRGTVIPTPITNFTAEIVADIQRDNGVELQRLFEMRAEVDGEETTFRIPASEFEPMRWVVEQAGARAVVAPGYPAREHARAAIQLLSNPVRRRSYSHTGWTQTDGGWVYLHAGGGIDADGADSVVEVDLDGALARYALPAPPTGERLVAAVRSSLSLLHAAGPEVTFPVLAAIYRAALGPCSHALHLVGETGAGKTTFAALAQQHYGPEMDAMHLPGSWTSTANHLEGMLFAAKDALTVVDDLTLGNSRRDREQAQRLAERVYRAQGNQQGRGRMRADATLKPTLHPRGLTVGTGEDLPAGKSLRARLMVVEFAPDTLDWDQITRLQRIAQEGVFAEALAGFIQWLAPGYGTFLGNELLARIAEQRERAVDSRHHRRTPELIASLHAGLYALLDFATDIDAISPFDADTLNAEGWAALGDAAARQLPHQASADVPTRFLSLLRSALTGGLAHVLDAEDGERPPDALRWGWTKFENEIASDWRPNGTLVGWVTGDDLFLDIDLALGATQRVAQDLGEHLGVTTSTLAKQLHERNLLRSTELRTRQTYAVRKTISGSRLSVLHLPAAALDPPVGSPSPTGPTERPTSQATVTAPPETGAGRTGQVAPHPTLASAQGAEVPNQISAVIAPAPSHPDPPDPTSQLNLPVTRQNLGQDAQEDG